MYELSFYSPIVGKSSIIGEYESELKAHQEAEKRNLDSYSISWYVFTNFKKSLMRIEHFNTTN